MLRIAVQSKGRLHDDTMALLEEAGLKISSMKRTLLVAARNYPVELLFLRDDDIPQTVADGTADAGIVGLNEVMERGGDVETVKNLGFGACRLSIAIPKGETYDGVSWLQGKRVATSYPEILRRYFDEKGIDAHIHVITGSVEISTTIGLADAIFDIVSSGSTLVSNNLKEVEVVAESEAVLVANPQLDAEKRAILEGLLFRIEAVLSAADKKYVLMNAPADHVEDILAVLPGIKSPTVMPLAQEGWCSIHTVLSETCFWEIIGKLKEKGAQGILVLPIEKMMI
jgi:ATP phosphoribosyltransferase